MSLRTNPSPSSKPSCPSAVDADLLAPGASSSSTSDQGSGSSSDRSDPAASPPPAAPCSRALRLRCTSPTASAPCVSTSSPPSAATALCSSHIACATAARSADNFDARSPCHASCCAPHSPTQRRCTCHPPPLRRTPSTASTALRPRTSHALPVTASSSSEIASHSSCVAGRRLLRARYHRLARLEILPAAARPCPRPEHPEDRLPLPQLPPAPPRRNIVPIDAIHHALESLQPDDQPIAVSPERRHPDALAPQNLLYLNLLECPDQLGQEGVARQLPRQAESAVLLSHHRRPRQAEPSTNRPTQDAGRCHEATQRFESHPHQAPPSDPSRPPACNIIGDHPSRRSHKPAPLRATSTHLRNGLANGPLYSHCSTHARAYVHPACNQPTNALQHQTARHRHFSKLSSTPGAASNHSVSPLAREPPGHRRLPCILPYSLLHVPRVGVGPLEHAYSHRHHVATQLHDLRVLAHVTAIFPTRSLDQPTNCTPQNNLLPRTLRILKPLNQSIASRPCCESFFERCQLSVPDVITKLAVKLYDRRRHALTLFGHPTMRTPKQKMNRRASRLTPIRTHRVPTQRSRSL
eukprot:7384818-Prymnesium_polylepis.4